MRRRLVSAVDQVLGAIAAGVRPSEAERKLVDLKEEAGRRGAGGVIQPGTSQNIAAADHLASEVACMANSPEGGALVVGIDDRTGAPVGTAMDREWLRHRIYQRVDVAPEVEERLVDGIRLLVLYVTPSPEPVEDPGAAAVPWRSR